MVVSASPLATNVGVRVLEAGGNAIDAAVATAFVLAVVEPTMSGIGGRTQVLGRTAYGDFFGIDGMTQLPSAVPEIGGDEDAYGYETIAIPGTVAALTEVLRTHGSWSLPEVLAPAIQVARGGFPLPLGEANRIAIVIDQLREFEGSRRHFLKSDGSPYRTGELFVQTDLARTMQAIADGGADVFYRGWIADSIDADMVRNGGYVRRSDLEGYEARPALVVHGSYRGYDLVGTSLPASGATTIEALHILENFDLAGRAGGAEWAALTAQALLLSFEDRTRESPQTVVSKDWAAQRAAEVIDPAAVPAAASREAAWLAAAEAPHTTHLSVADREGMVVALTQSVGPNMGSKVAAPGLGFVYAATMGYLSALEPGSRPWTSQSPFIVTRNGETAYVLGAAGARRIISAIVAVMSRIVDQGLSLPDAMAAPRLHPTATTIYMEDRAEASWLAADLADLRSFGFTIEARDSPSYFARISGIAHDQQGGIYLGVADARWTGTAKGLGR
jgi:gamma-glutamyltranspeptidase/glutathione hydrolase